MNSKIEKNRLNDTLIDNMTKEDLLSLYKEMLLIRKFETVAQENFKKGEIPGFIHLCIGQEAVAVGICHQLRKSDWITSTHRGHGHALAKGLDEKIALAELYGKATGCSGGRGGSMHLYSVENGIFGTNGLVGGGLPLAVGLGISEVQKGTDNISVAFLGDGTINHGSFHESVGLAAMRKSPVVFVCENNLYATSTPYAITGRNISIAGKAMAYGIEGIKVDGNDVLAVHRAMEKAMIRARSGGGPTLIEAITYRIVGHYEGDIVTGVYRTKEEVEQWKELCPLKQYKQYLLEKIGIAFEDINVIDSEIEKRINAAVEFARISPFPQVSTLTDNCFQRPINPKPVPKYQITPEGGVVKSWLTAVRDGIAEEMRKDPNILYFGEGIGERGGSFGHTKDIWKEFGNGRVIDTPICESAFTGAAAAASATGCRSIADLMYADFIFEAASQIINQISKLRYISNGQITVPLVIRAGIGQIKQAGPQHSGTFHSIWAHIPGLLVVVPSTPVDAKGLMKAALHMNDPVLFLEPKALYSSKCAIPEEEYFIPFGKARLVLSGSDITIVSFGLPVLTVTAAAKQLREEGIYCDVLDIRTLVPLDISSIQQSVERTGRLLIVEEAYSTCSFSSEITTQIVETVFDKLKAPVGRLNQQSIPQPFSPVLEAAAGINTHKVKEAVLNIIAGKPGRAQMLAVAFENNEEAEESPIISSDASKKVKLSEDEKLKYTASTNDIAITIPNIGLTITEVQITKWHKKVGDDIKKGDELCEFESEKSSVVLEAEYNGKLSAILEEGGKIASIGQIVGYIAAL